MRQGESLLAALMFRFFAAETPADAGKLDNALEKWRGKVGHDGTGHLAGCWAHIAQCCSRAGARVKRSPMPWTRSWRLTR